MNHTDRQQDAQQEIEDLSKNYQPNITRGFDIKHFKLLRALGQGMNGSVRIYSWIVYSWIDFV